MISEWLVLVKERHRQARLHVQIVMTRNKEAVLSEKDMRCNLGQTCLVGYAEHINPSKFASFDDFMTAVQTSWDREWKRVYSAEWSGKLSRFRTKQRPVNVHYWD